MTFQSTARAIVLWGLTSGLAACGGLGSGGSVGSFGSANIFGGGAREKAEPERERTRAGAERKPGETTIWDLFSNTSDPNTTVEVNKYLWQASLEVLNFLPIQSVDPFSGVIVTGFGSPPGGGGAYRATIYVQDPALDARSLKVALVGRGGPVDADTQRAVEDAILTRARQLRIRDSKL